VFTQKIERKGEYEPLSPHLDAMKFNRGKRDLQLFFGKIWRTFFPH